MKKKNSRREFLQRLGIISFVAGTESLVTLRASAFGSSHLEEELKSLPPSELFSVLDLSKPELADVRKALNEKGYDAALSVLLIYYRNRFPSPSFGTSAHQHISTSTADNVCKHIFQWGPYPAADYGADINWAADPAGDIEWIAAIYRFFWVSDLAAAYSATGDEKYAQAFVDLTTDWIRKHPLEKTVDCMHPVYGWKGYPWLDLQTGIRAASICNNFPVLVHAKSFTPQFLGILLASLYDHQTKTEKMPMGRVHNKAIFEQKGFFTVIHTFPEFKDKERWLDIAITITAKSLMDQTTADGVQREWCGGYHLAVYSDALGIENRVKEMGRQMPESFSKRVRAMADYVFGISTPDLGFPMFGDTGRGKPASNDRKTWPLYKVLANASKNFKDPKYLALAELNRDQLPVNGSIAFAEAGIYALRSGWSTNDVYMALHCSAPAISGHDSPDNGTFELYAYGRWLMPDTGFFTYGHDAKAREWHRQTKVHPTLTLKGKDTLTEGRQLFWESTADTDILCVENQSYKDLVHRRTVWFSGKKSTMPFFVILDEAAGDAKGDPEIHFPMALGVVKIDNEKKQITTGFEDSNLHIQVKAKKTVSLNKEEGWTAWEYGEREPRTSVTAVYKREENDPVSFISLLVPYKGKTTPDCRILSDPASVVLEGKGIVEIKVEVDGQKHLFRRKI
jgi:heparan-sulfate lyase